MSPKTFVGVVAFPHRQLTFTGKYFEYTRIRGQIGNARQCLDQRSFVYKRAIHAIGKGETKMGMDSKKLIGIVCVCSLVFGILGGAIGSRFLSGDRENVTFKTVTITDGLLIKAKDSEGPGCKLLPDGTATLTGGLIAHQVRGQIFSGQTFLASANPINATLNDQMVMAQMTADPKTGGRIIVRSRAATLIPANGETAQGNMAVIAFNAQNGRAEIFTQDMTDLKTGRAYMVVMSQKPATPNGTAPEATAQTRDQAGIPPKGTSKYPSTQPLKSSGRTGPNDPAMSGMREGSPLR